MYLPRYDYHNSLIRFLLDQLLTLLQNTIHYMLALNFCTHYDSHALFMAENLDILISSLILIALCII
jgi:hypothetical protein